MTDPYEAKYEEMQKYVPFIQRVIEKLKVNNDHQADNPRKAQLQKMEMLHDLLTNKQKKIKIETLMKCEGVLIKLQAKIEKNEDLILGDVKLKNQVPCKSTSCTSKDAKYLEDDIGPASPPPEIIPSDDINQPIVIPTERRCSPILVKETLDKTQQHKIETLDRTKQPHDSKSNHFQNHRKTICGNSKLPANKQTPSQDKHGSLNQNSSHSSFKGGTHDRNHDKEQQHQKHFKHQNSQNSNVSKERNAEGKKSLATEQKLQTVKVVITEPLPARFKQQHFPPTSKFLPRSSVCHNNLKTLPSNGPTKTDNEAYSPEQSWDQLNESNSKLLNVKMPSAAPVFIRLGEKVLEEPQKSKTSGRYTPIPDVLKSPPLSVSDINNLLLESGSDKTLKDISEIGTRRPPKTENSQKESDNHSFEFVRKKLAQTAKLCSPQAERVRRSISPNRNISPLPSERIALKYNPHPRQERLHSVSSTDSSECSTQSKNNNPRINSISIAQRSPSQVAASNVNVLPAINLSDPRLKRQPTPLPTPPERKSLLPTPTFLTPSQNTGFLNQNPIYCRRSDPRISRVANNAPSSSVSTTPFQRMSTNQSQHISEHNWDSDEEKKAVKSERRYEKNDNCERAPCDDRNVGPTVRSTLNESCLQKTTSENEPSTSKQFHQPNTNLKHIPPKEQQLCKTKHTNAKNKSIPATKYVVPNAPKSDTEEDWDSEPEATNFKVKPLAPDVPQSPVNSSSAMPVVSPYLLQISPKALLSPKPPVHLAHMPHVPHIQPQYPKVGSNIHHSYRHQNPPPNNRFNYVLNDTSERVKYFEAKKQKSVEPQTYREFREAKEKALAQEAAMKSAAEEAEAKKRCHVLKETHTGTAKLQNANEQKAKQIDNFKKLEDYKKGKKPPHKDATKILAGESTLDKMYRTQNFNTSFPKANTSFKIPKKKTEEKVKEDTLKSNETALDQTKVLSSDKIENKLKSSQTDTTTGKIKSEELDRKQESKKSSNITTKKDQHKHLDLLKKSEESPCEDKSSENDSPQASNESSSGKASVQAQKPVTDKINLKSEYLIKSDKTSGETEKKVVPTEPKGSLQEHLIESDMTVESNQSNVRDPRFRSKTTSAPVVTDDFTAPQDKTSKILGDIITTSSENHQNLEKFNKLTQQMPPKPQRILRRRNTMVVFDSAPLVDKEKLRKANALLFEDVQEEEKRKLKKDEEDRLLARRNKNLEEMFKRTDDNCTVSTQNIITGKRRTRATINFNETVNAINVFKHLTIKDTSAGNVNPAPSISQAVKPVRSNFKIKIKNLALCDKQKTDDSDDDKPLRRIATKETKVSLQQPKPNDSKPKAIKDTQLDENKTDESEIETKTKTKPTWKCTSSISRKLSNCGENHEAKFTPIQNEEHQNCAVSSTSADNYNAEENTCSSTSTQRSYKRETDDNEPTSTASKSNNPTPTPEPNEPILREIVDQILKPDSNREPILDILAQILSEEKLTLIKSLIESSNKQKSDEERVKGMEDTDKQNLINNISKKESPDDGEDEQEERKKILSSADGETKKITIPKKKRSELDRLNEDIRDMFICNGVLTATGRRMCTIIGKDVASTSGKDSSKESTPGPISKQDNCSKKKCEILKPPITPRNLRRSTRSCKTTEDNEDNESILSRTTDDSTDDIHSTADSAAMDATTLRKMPILKPYSPIKIPADVSSKALPSKETGRKRKPDNKLDMKAKKIKINDNDSKQDSESDEKKSETELDKAEDEAMKFPKVDVVIKNTNLHWHNQSKYTTWCMICEKRIPANSSSVHYKTHHRENYISRMAPVLLQQYKQEKLSKPLFGIKRAQKQPSWFSRCPFCLKYLNTPLPLWLEHFQNHTVEFRYECSKCFRSSNKKITISRHTKSCIGATVLTAAVKLSVPSLINAHVCHLCNFIQLRRDNLERHYIEQHQLEEKTVDLLGYTIKLFDVENVECVSEEKATQKEKEVWESIARNEQVIDIDDDDTAAEEVTETCVEDSQNEIKDGSVSNNNLSKRLDDKVTTKENAGDGPSDLAKTTDAQPKEIVQQAETTKSLSKQATKSKSHKKKVKTNKISHLIDESPNNNFEVIDQEATVRDIQDELLALAAKAAENEKEQDEENSISSECNRAAQLSSSSDRESAIRTATDTILTNFDILNETPINKPTSEPQTTMSDIISSSIDMIYSTDNPLSEPVKVSQAASNVFMSTREVNYSPTIQILAQSIINIEEQENQYVKDKPITMAERLSQRFKDLQSESTAAGVINNSAKTASDENAFEKLIDDTLLELTREKDSANKKSSSKTPAGTTAITDQLSENVFNKLFNDTVLELENNDIEASEIQSMQEQETTNVTQPQPQPQTDSVTVISDDEDWEDIEITETAPTVSSTGPGNIQKTKSKGLFQKFGMFKGSNTKSKKHLPPMVFLPKKKTKEKSPSATGPSSSSSHLPITTVAAASASKANEIMTSTSPSNSSTANLGFKPVINIMDGLFPDSPCNDPIDLVPELAPLEPLQDLNDISSILDSNLSAVNINAADNHTSIEDALDFISEQQANDKQKLNLSAFSIAPNQTKTTINNITHVGFSVQNAAENSFKFYCLLQNCSFLYSSDSIGLEAHFMCEHSQIKWNGYCLMCQAQCFPVNADAIAEYPISKEIRHMVEKHAINSALDLNTDSTQNSNSSNHDADGRPKIKLRRLTGDCLSRATPENVSPVNDFTSIDVATNVSTPLTMLGALLVADPKPPTREMPPQPQMPLTEPLLLDKNTDASSQLSFRNVNSDFLITSVTSADSTPNHSPLQISNVVSLNNKAMPAETASEQIQMPKISNVRTLAPKGGGLWTQLTGNEGLELAESATSDSLEISGILQNAGDSSKNMETARPENDSPVLIAETVPIAQSTTGDFVVTQTLSAQYNEFCSTALGFNISIAASTTGDNTNAVSTPAGSSSASVASRQYKCMGSGCKFVSRVPVAMSDHLRFHERRNFSNKRDYLSCGFCFYYASDVDDYMKHANEFHIINKGVNASSNATTPSESDTATSLTKKIHNILNSKNGPSVQTKYSVQSQQSGNQTKQIQDSHEVYLKKLKATIDEIVGPTGLADDKLYRCVVKNCQAHLTESTFLKHIIFHITSTGVNPNNYLYKCPHCTAQYHRPAGIKAHIKNHARNRYFCYLCDETSTNPGQLLKHFSEKHWHTLNMYTKELLPLKSSSDGSDSATDSNYYVAYTQDLSAEEVRKFGEKLILEWQRKKSGSKTHFKSSEIDLLPLSAIFQRQVNCGECEYKTKVRTNMFRHLLMHKQNPGLANKKGASSVVDPVNPVPCLNSNERFFDKMTNLASSSLIPASSAAATTKSSFKLPYAYVEEGKRYVCGYASCNYHTICDDLFRAHLSALHSTEMTYSCPFCKEEVCKRGISIDRIISHTRFHSIIIYRCEECNYFHHLRYVVERHINEKHSTMKVNVVTHMRSNEDSVEGTTTMASVAGKKFNPFESNLAAQISNSATRSTTNDSSAAPKPTVTPITNVKGKARWECDVCGHIACTVGQIQTHCQQQHSVKNQYKCAHCNFGSQQLSHILHHIDEKHSGKSREARTMYHKIFNNNEEVADTRPLWQRNDPTRVRHIRGILMEDEDESEEYRKKLALTEDVDEDSSEEQPVNVEDTDELKGRSYILGYEFGCYHCSFKTQTFEELKERHYNEIHNCKLDTSKPFWYRLHRRLCCPECRSFLGNYNEMQQHLQSKHKKRFYAADIKMAENDDTSQRILCGYCSFHCANADHLYKHHIKAQHWPQDIRIDNNEQIMEILALGKSEVSYQCSLCADIYSNQVAIVQHACNSHAGEETFSYRELKNSLIYRCNSCCFTSTVEMELLRHTIDHYSRFKICSFCDEAQSSFNAYMQHCYAEHKNKIEKFRTIYPFAEIKKFLLQILVIFPSGLVLNKRNLLNTKYGKTYIIYELYEEIYKISQQPPIPRLSIARLVARKSVEAQQKNVESSSALITEDALIAVLPCPKPISKRRRTVAFDLENDHTTSSNNSPLKPNKGIVEEKTQSAASKRRISIDHEQQVQQLFQQEEFSAPLRDNKISKRRRTVAVDRDTLFSTNLKSSSNTLLTELEGDRSKRKISFTHSSEQHVQEVFPLNLDMEPFSFYGKKPEILDLSKIYTKVAIGGVKTPLTIDKFKLLFNIDCQLKLTKCDEDNQLLAYSDYKHIKKACPASEKLRYD